MSFLGEIIVGALQDVLREAGAKRLSRWLDTASRSPRLRKLLTAFEFVAMAVGGLAVLLAVIGFGAFLHQWSLERLVHREAPASAVIASIDRKQTGSNGYVDIRLDYIRQTASGPLACRDTPARIISGSQDLQIGTRIDVYARPDSCSQPVYAPDIGDSRETLLISAAAFPIGTVLLFLGCAAYRGRQYRLAMISDKPGAADPVLPGPAAYCRKVPSLIQIFFGTAMEPNHEPRRLALGWVPSF